MSEKSAQKKAMSVQEKADIALRERQEKHTSDLFENMSLHIKTELSTTAEDYRLLTTLNKVTAE
eukprot:Awhi_evm2s1297